MIDITDVTIDAILLSGSNFCGGKQRIINFFKENHSSSEKEEYLKKEYGVGGCSERFDGVSEDHNSSGIKIHTVKRSVFLSWKKVAKRIDELIADGLYEGEIK